MSISDYILCFNCNVKLIYDGGSENRKWWVERFGSFPEIECPKCKKQEELNELIRNELIRADEREACAKLCDEAVKMNLETKDYISKTSSPTEGERIFIETAICLAAKQQAEKLANGIRARGEVK